MIYLLLALILLPGVVQAEEFSNIIHNHKLVSDEHVTLVTCDEALKKCWTPCEIKMRRAMGIMNEALEKNLETKRGDFYEMMIIAIYDKDKQQWNATMKECVP